MDDAWLAKIQRPAQYIGGEYNSITKDWDKAAARLVFCFPDTYEIGMSHLGLRLLYEAVNREDDLLCERCFAPEGDMRQALLDCGRPLSALESGHVLADFDVIGFTLQYELSYTNVLDMLHMARLPLLATERANGPLVIAGGPCAFNPEPLSDFIDLFCLGESEEQLPALLRLAARAKQQGWSKQELLRQAVKLPGLYAPALYEARYDEKGRFAELAPLAGAPERVLKAVVRDVDKAPFPAAPLLPATKVVHDRIMLELMRGCGRGCRFCQAGMIYRPVREKEPSLLCEQARVLAANSGYEDIGLISLSSADYSQIGPLMRELSAQHGGSGVGLSLPSLRVDAFSVALAAAAGKVRKSGLTFAPEAGSQRLRDIINKGVREEDILSALTAAFAQGYSTVKLYFMIGLPYETFEDIAAIAALCKNIVGLFRRHRPAYVKKPLAISLGIASFVPKAHTPFQWCAQDSAESLREKQRYLRDLIRPLKQVSLRYHDTEASLLEAALARGDRRLGPVLHQAWRLGCRADGWTEHFQPARWREAYSACGLSPEQYANQAYEKEDPLPWQHIESGVSREWLWQEYEKAREGALTVDCRNGACTDCGVCTALDCRLKLAQPLSEDVGADSISALAGANHQSPAVGDAHPGVPRIGADSAPAEQRQRWRLRLAVQGPARWLSQLDLLAALEKALRRAGLPLAFSQGFNPHMLISWGPAHPVGLAGQSEYTDITFAGIPPADWHHKLNAVLPPGFTVLAAAPIAETSPALMAAIDRADYTLTLIDDFDGPAVDQAIAALLAGESHVVERFSPKGRKTADVRPTLLSLRRDGDTLHFSCRLNAGAVIKPEELTQAVAPGAQPGDYTRTGMYIKGEEPIEAVNRM